MTVLAMAIGNSTFAVAPVTVDLGADQVRRLPVPVLTDWYSCRDLLLDVAGDDEITAIGIACPDTVYGTMTAATMQRWRRGFTVVAAVRRLFPVAVVEMATDRLCETLAYRTFGAGDRVDPALAGAGVLALLAEDRADGRTAPDDGADASARFLGSRAGRIVSDRNWCRRRPSR
ncbi:hypothetical protein [Nocardia spumae]|uniref:hypothetical protein n=1 Tax=Nocardia spumae TaxID=2887190 RepID=UPI001D151F50|nr:hypothetical protein [Nocardia spumae]